MSCSSGNSSGRSVLTEDARKRKRMESNRDSARRSRLRKQKHVDDLTTQIDLLLKEKTQIVSGMNVTNQSYIAVESQNSVLRAQKNELTQRLQSLNEILSFVNMGNGFVDDFQTMNFMMMGNNNMYLMNQQKPIMASSDMFQYY
ncbi:bZIP transcription factor 11-like [Impatiens glandulifera]|uniref:bZIP transcription factor 11-like n=1 Tax=Impatiens glandulifera TaxID=253017 RepID=UPI001FB0F889|nr:bZIP transcription factor 11-like [Impatiens glandulifera]